jgi:hypothetical protein
MTSRTDANFRLDAVPQDMAWGEFGRSLFPRVARTSLSEPGVALLQWTRDLTSRDLRSAMVALYREFLAFAKSQWNLSLQYLSLGRFDQQTTTRFHLDGGPEVSFLMLGYEPSRVDSQFAIADYSQAAFDAGCQPAEYLDRYNPMFPEGASRIVPYAFNIDAFNPSLSQILLINNSRQGWAKDTAGQLGVMHQGTISLPDPMAQRIINSTMIGIPAGSPVSLNPTPSRDRSIDKCECFP